MTHFVERIFHVCLMLCFVMAYGKIQAQVETRSLMPVPAEVTYEQGKFRLDPQFTAGFQGSFDDRLYATATRFLRRLEGRTGIFPFQEMLSSADKNPQASILIQVERAAKIALHEDESYELQITDTQIRLKAPTDLGAIRGLETILQLLETDEKGYYFPAVTIRDAPRFPWRGLMIDVARHFMPVDVILRNLDAMAAVKLNVFHFHLTDNQGFRIESKQFPRLHELGGERQYYTQQDIKRIIEYADQRGIRVVPELDLPAHATSWLVAYPQYSARKDTIYQKVERKAGIFDPVLDPTREETYEFVEAVLTEILPLFPDAYAHIGGDENEAGKDWNENPDIQAFMKKNNIPDNHALQAYFNQRMLKIFTKLGKKMLGWEEILHPNLPKDAIIHSWFGKESLFRAVKAGHEAMLSNGYYIDVMQSAEHHYRQDVILPEGANLTPEESKRILGGEVTMWTELATPRTLDSRIWPRSIAIAERFWSPAHVTDIDDMYRRLDIISPQLEEHGLQHITWQNSILRNLSAGENIEPLRTLIGAIAPLQGYKRNPDDGHGAGAIFTMLSPMTLLMDAANADPKEARIFRNLVRCYLDNQDNSKETEIRYYLTKWAENHAQIQKTAQKSPNIRPILSLSENLKRISHLGLKVLDGNEIDYPKALKMLHEARNDHSGRCDIQVVDAIERIVKKNYAYLEAVYTPKAPKIDGKLADWKDAPWAYFTHSQWYFQADTCRFAMRWDDKNLYIAFDVRNINLQATHNQRDAKGLHYDDGIEILIDPKGDAAEIWQEDDIAYHVNILNVIYDEKGMKNNEFDQTWNGKAKTAVQTYGTINALKPYDKGYAVEVAITWKELGISPKDTDFKPRINLAVNDIYDRTGKYRYYDYMKLTMFHQPAGFAKLKLVK